VLDHYTTPSLKSSLRDDVDAVSYPLTQLHAQLSNALKRATSLCSSYSSYVLDPWWPARIVAIEALINKYDKILSLPN